MGDVKTVKTIKTIKLAGEVFYMFENPGELPLKRMVSYLARVKEISWGMTETDLTVFQDKIDTYIDEGKYEEVKIINTYVRTLRSMNTTIDNCINLVDCFVLLEGEDPAQCQPGFLSRKKELCESSEDVLTFF